ncbi:endonuclease/exonuclease/phosphatase family protein [Rhodobacteraceae bacterium F11138]|nr:endonuclease/exonuclease/phosphatase family protein [Rhodobacteraceae bacterium F11138]
MVMELVYGGLTLLICLATVLPEMRDTSWVIRMFDIPRLQIAALALMLFAVGLFAFADRPYVALIALAGALIVQASKILPFTALGRTEVTLAPDAPDRIKVLIANVLQGNDQYERLAELIRKEDPDILFLMETDAAWVQAMEPVLRDYPVRVDLPLDNYYGLAFASRLETRDARVVYLSDDDTPALLARMVSPCGRDFCFVGLHPRPPVPGTDTDERDQQILYSARFAREKDVPVITAGDFNAAAWGRASQRFKYIGEYLDPRRGRGMFPSFDARSRLLRCPIDQLYVTQEIAVADFRRGADIGSDHFPFIAVLSLDPATAKRANRPIKPLAEPLRMELDQKIDDYAKRLEQARKHADSR